MAKHKLIEGAEEALAFARGEAPAARLTVNGHAYVPESSLPKHINELTERLRTIIQITKPGDRGLNEMVRDLDLACSHARAALLALTQPRQI